MWRPKNWDSDEMHLDMLRAGIDCMDGKAFIEAGADAIHKADIAWLRDKYWTLKKGGTSIFIKDEDWQLFIANE